MDVWLLGSAVGRTSSLLLVAVCMRGNSAGPVVARGPWHLHTGLLAAASLCFGEILTRKGTRGIQVVGVFRFCVFCFLGLLGFGLLHDQVDVHGYGAHGRNLIREHDEQEHLKLRNLMNSQRWHSSPQGYPLLNCSRPRAARPQSEGQPVATGW